MNRAQISSDGGFGVGHVGARVEKEKLVLFRARGGFGGAEPLNEWGWPHSGARANRGHENRHLVIQLKYLYLRRRIRKCWPVQRHLTRRVREHGETVTK